MKIVCLVSLTVLTKVYRGGIFDLLQPFLDRFLIINIAIRKDMQMELLPDCCCSEV